MALTFDEILYTVTVYFGLRRDILRTSARYRAVAFPRMVAMYLMRVLLGASYPEIGRRTGGRDHSTVISAVKKITKMRETDADVRRVVNELETKLKPQTETGDQT